MKIEDMRKLALSIFPIADKLAIETNKIRKFCHEVISAARTTSDGLDVGTLDELRARIIEIAESIPTEV